MRGREGTKGGRYRKDHPLPPIPPLQEGVKLSDACKFPFLLGVDYGERKIVAHPAS